ncbi:MAG: hypothetical protein AB7S75_23335 [Desulfococcaceae bacterium]
MSENKVITFGEFIEEGTGKIEGHLSLSFHSNKLNMDELWESSSLSAKFLSTFWGKFLPISDPASVPLRKQIQDEVHYISGELLGNAVKFSYDPEFLIEICLYLHENELRFYVSNTVIPENLDKFKNIIKRLLSEDPAAYFLEQMEKSAAEGSTESGVGFLTLINDYGVNLSWKFEEKASGVNIVTTLARVPVVRK